MRTLLFVFFVLPLLLIAGIPIVIGAVMFAPVVLVMALVCVWLEA
jgi:hypothetical protein